MLLVTGRHIFNPEFADNLARGIENAKYAENATQGPWNELIKNFRTPLGDTPASDRDLRRALERFYDAYVTSDSPTKGPCSGMRFL